MGSGDSIWKTSTSCSSLPLCWSTHSARNDLPSFWEEVIQTRPSPMTGEDQPSPGNAVFQRMFSFSLQVKGSPVAPVRPSPDGPRNCGHSLAAWDVAAKASQRATARESIEKRYES